MKTVLGPLCKRGHDHECTGQSLRYVSGRQCVVCSHEHTKNWSVKNRDKLKKMANERYHKDRKKSLAIAKKWRTSEKGKVTMSRWRAKNKGKIAKTKKNWASTEDGRACLRRHWRLAYLRRKGYRLTDELIGKIHSTHGYDCVYCGSVADTYDHVIPVTKNSGHDERNLVPCCRHCNQSKHNEDWEVWWFRQDFFDKKKYQRFKRNIQFVAWSRSKSDLIFVSTPDKKG